MAELVLTDAKVWFDGVDISGHLNAIAFNTGAEILDSTKFGSGGFRQKLAGLKLATFAHEGHFSAGTATDIDDHLFPRVGSTGLPMTAAAEGGQDGEDAWLLRVAEAEYSPISGAVGEILSISFSGESSDDTLVKGTIMANLTAQTSSASGVARQLGAPSASQEVFAALHVLAASGSSPTLDVDIESDDAMGFASATVRGSFAQATAVGSEWLAPIAGPITDDWWRINFAIAGGTPSFDFTVAIGIQ